MMESFEAWVKRHPISDRVRDKFLQWLLEKRYKLDTLTEDSYDNLFMYFAKDYLKDMDELGRHPTH